MAYDAVGSGRHQLVSLAKADLKCEKAAQGTLALKAKQSRTDDEDHPNRGLKCQINAS